MNSPFAKMFIALQAYILAQVPAIVYIDMDYGQLEMKERPGVSFPCVLIDFHEWNFSDLSNLVQQAAGNISFKLATNPYSSTASITPDTWKQDALLILDLEYDLYMALEGLKIAISDTNKAGPLGRTHYGTDNRRPGMKVRHMIFSASFQDYAAKRTTNLITPPPPEITGNMTFPA